MRVYLDDSGDAGLKIGHGSSRWIVMTACVFEYQWQVDRTLECIEKARIRLFRIQGVVVT